jgi:hypothetical protein
MIHNSKENTILIPPVSKKKIKAGMSKIMKLFIWYKRFYEIHFIAYFHRLLNI